MSWFDDLEAELERYGKYIDPNGKIKNLILDGPLGGVKLAKEGYDEGGISGALSNFTDLAGIPKRALIDSPVNAVSELMVGEQENIRPAEEVTAEALFPDRDISGETPNIFPETGNPSISQFPVGFGLEEKELPINRDPEVEKQNQEIDDIINHIGRGVTRTGVGLATDPLLPIMAASGPVGAIAGAAFVPEMAKSGGEELGTAIALGADQGDIGGALEHGIGGVTNLGMSLAGGLHTGKGVAKEISPLVPGVLNKQVVWEAPKEPIPITKQEIPNPNSDVITTSADRLTTTETKPTSEKRTPHDDWLDEALGIEPDKPVTPLGESATESNPYFEVKPLIDSLYEKLPFEYDPTRLGVGGGGFKGKGPKDSYEGPYADIERDIEGIDGIATPEEVASPIPKVKNIPSIPKGETDIRTAINKRTEEIKSLVVGIDPVKARKLAMLDIAREEATKSALPSSEIIETPKVTQVEGTAPELVETPIVREPRVKAEVEEVLPVKRYQVTMEDGSTHILKGTDPIKIKAFAEERWGKLAESRELAKGERIGGKKPPAPPKDIASPKDEPLKSESNPSESSLLDDITDLPKTLKSSFDVSFPARQGLFLLNRATGRKAILRGTKSGISEKSHLEIQRDLSSRSNADLYKQFGLNQVKYDPTEANSLSEQHPLFKTNPSKFSKEVQKIPGLKQTERMFTDSGNLTRADMFDMLHKKWSAQGKTPETRPDLYHGLSKYLNVLTGRDPLSAKLQQASHILNKAFWSPQYVKSRLQMLNPVFYAKLPREVQLEAIRDVGGTLGTLTILLSAVNYAAKQSGQENEIHVEWNPTHSDFGKLRVGKTKYDFFTGLVPIIRTASRIATSRKETPKGKYQLKGGFGLGNDLFEPKTEYLPLSPFGQSGFSELGQFAEGKTAPAYQIGKGLLSGKDYFGGDYDIPDFISDAVAPMGVADIISAWKNHDAKEGMKALPSILGVGVQTDKVKDTNNFSWKKKKKKKKSSGNELLLY